MSFFLFCFITVSQNWVLHNNSETEQEIFLTLPETKEFPDNWVHSFFALVQVDLGKYLMKNLEVKNFDLPSLTENWSSQDIGESRVCMLGNTITRISFQKVFINVH